jgi:predicted DsbA family dithiol-disulfide isomerase
VNAPSDRSPAGRWCDTAAVTSHTGHPIMTVVEVFADITCPFTHVGLKRVVEHVAEMERPAIVHVRAWPLEWVNGAPLEVAAVEMKAEALTEQLGSDDFSGLRVDRWPATTIPALALAAQAYARGPDTGLAISLSLRSALFEHGHDVGDPEVLAAIASDHGLTGLADADAVRADYEEGLRRGVSGSPHFWVGDDEFFCPALDLGHDADGRLTARLDTEGLAEFFARIDA